MPAAPPGPSFSAMNTNRTPSPLVLSLIGLMAANLVGLAVALATGIVEPVPGFLNGSRTNAPLVIWGAQTLGVWLLVARGRRAGGALALAASTLSLVAVCADGDLFADGLGAGHIAIQLTIAAFTFGFWALVAARLVRSPARAATA